MVNFEDDAAMALGESSTPGMLVRSHTLNVTLNPCATIAKVVTLRARHNELNSAQCLSARCGRICR